MSTTSLTSLTSFPSSSGTINPPTTSSTFTIETFTTYTDGRESLVASSTPGVISGTFVGTGSVATHTYGGVRVSISSVAHSTPVVTVVTGSRSSAGSSSGSNMGIIVGSVIGGMVLGLLLAAAIWCCCRKRRRKRQRIVNPYTGGSRASEVDNSSSGQSAPMLQVGSAAVSPNARIANWLARMNSQKTRTSEYSNDPPEYKSQRTAPSDSVSVYSQPAENPFGPGSYRAYGALPVVEESRRQADYLVYDLGHLKN